MNSDFDHPLLIACISFFILWLAAWVGWSVLRTRRAMDQGAREDYGLIVSSTLTLLALLIGFSFSMAVTRYDLRKNYEEAEANAIGTEYVRAGLLPSDDAKTVRSLLSDYLDQRIAFYRSRDALQLRQIDSRTAQLQNDLWSAVQAPATAQPTPVLALAVSGMNDVLNSQGYTQAAWWNRIPQAAWVLMAILAICCNLLVGYGAQTTSRSGLLLILPLIVSLAFLLVADIDSPRSGFIHVTPQNLLSLSASLPAH